ncbi:T9SS type A sorting domain-containing protein [bacterium]|jgi:hypothetical protein|nr:T9SS type A sorting domain-containing protein [bacterium]
MKKIIIFILLIFISIDILSQPSWNRVNYCSSTCFTGIVNFNGHNADTNDIIGIFVNGECRMKSNIIILNDTSYISSVIHSDGTTENAIIKFWDYQTDMIYDIDTFLLVTNHGSLFRFPINIKSDKTNIEYFDYGLNIFPNPFDNYIELKSDSEIKNIIIYEPNGTIIDYKTNCNYINTNIFIPGVYIITIELINGYVISKTLIK